MLVQVRCLGACWQPATGRGGGDRAPHPENHPETSIVSVQHALCMTAAYRRAAEAGDVHSLSSGMRCRRCVPRTAPLLRFHPTAPPRLRAPLLLHPPAPPLLHAAPPPQPHPLPPPRLQMAPPLRLPQMWRLLPGTSLPVRVWPWRWLVYGWHCERHGRNPCVSCNVRQVCWGPGLHVPAWHNPEGSDERITRAYAIGWQSTNACYQAALKDDVCAYGIRGAAER